MLADHIKITVRDGAPRTQRAAPVPLLDTLVWLMLACLVAGTRAAADEATWILVNTSELTLQVLQGETVLRSFGNIAVGQNGVAGRRQINDGKTPLGSYRISNIRNGKQTRFYRFFEIDYPSLEDARRAFASGRISEADLAAILHAHEYGRQPPASTPLGGNIGIHGLGTGDARVHQDYNWTDGCIALDNKQIDELAQWVRPGMTVVIH